MNIRDFIFINKAKSTDRIKILEMLGFETETVISQNPQDYSGMEEITENEVPQELNIYSEIKTEVREPSSIESYINDTKEVFNNDSDQIPETVELPTETFKPVNVTSKIQKIWSDVESRRQWVMPLLGTLLTITIIGTAINAFTTRSAQQEEVIEVSSNLASETNNLIEGLQNVLEISTDTFYSKYDISNASAYLQSVESSTLEYQSLIIQKEDVDLVNINYNLSTIFTLVNDLDDLLTYRILVSEVLIYDTLLEIDETTEVDVLTVALSEITATSKRNYDELPEIAEMNNHKNLINTAIITAEDLHGRLLAALRNTEYDVVEAIANALLLNKETELVAFENSLAIFETNKTATYESIQQLD